MQYNYQKYVELLKYYDSLRKQNKFLKDENKLKYLELKNYSLQINEHLHWCQKDKYLELIEDFLSVKIDGKTFESKFSSLVDPIDIGNKSTNLPGNRVLIKGTHGRYVVEIFGDQVNVLGICARGNRKNVKTFESLMNEMYGVNLQY